MRALVVRGYTSDLAALPVEDDWPEPGAPAAGAAARIGRRHSESASDSSGTQDTGQQV